MKKILRITSLFCIISFIFNVNSPTYVLAKPTKQVTLSVKSSPDATFKTEFDIYGDKRFISIEETKAVSLPHPVTLSDLYVTISNSKGRDHYLVSEQGNFIDLKGQKMYIIPKEAKAKLWRYAKTLRNEHYGKLVRWEKVDDLIPVDSTFKVIDLKTGKHFSVQRRAGDSHADVQPLTFKDTKIMKEIYNGRWSWRRRAILVQIDGRTIAASMHGKPHGAGALQNGFPGHFCIHFLGSQTHRSKTMDPTHKVMILKAAGKIDDFLASASAEQIVETFVIAVNQSNPHLIRKTLYQEDAEKTQDLLDTLEDYEVMRLDEELTDKKQTGHFAVAIKSDVAMYIQGEGDERASWTFNLRRQSPDEDWKIDVETLIETVRGEDEE